MQIQRDHSLHVTAIGGVAGEPRVTLGVENKDAARSTSSSADPFFEELKALTIDADTQLKTLE